MSFAGFFNGTKVKESASKLKLGSECFYLRWYFPVALISQPRSIRVQGTMDLRRTIPNPMVILDLVGDWLPDVDAPQLENGFKDLLSLHRYNGSPLPQ